MPGLDVDVGGAGYALRESRDGSKITTRPVRQFVQPMRMTGRTRPEDLAPYESFVIPNLTLGFGRKRINSDSAFTPEEYRRFFDSTCETRWMDSVYLPILAEDSDDDDFERIKASVHFAGKLNGLWNDGSSSIVVNKQYTGSSTTWENGGDPFPALTLDAESEGGATNSASLTISHTVAVKPHRVLVVMVASVHDPSGVTYGGTALTELADANSGGWATMWYLANPATGTNNVVVSGSSGDYAAQVNSYYGANPVDVFNTVAEAANAGSANHTATLSVTSEAGDIVVDAIYTDNGGSLDPGASQTALMDRAQDDIQGGSSHETATGSSTTMSWTVEDSEGYSAHVAAAVKNPNLKIGLDMIAHKANMVALAAADKTHLIATSADGVTWNSPTTSITGNLLNSNVSAQEDRDAGLLASIGGELVAAVWHESNGTITFFSSSDGGTVFADEAIDIGSGHGPTGLVTYPDIDGQDKLYLGTAEGIWKIDTAPSTWTFELIYPMSFDTNNCRRMTIHQGALWFAEGAGKDSPAPIYRMMVQGDSRVVESGYGLSYGDGVPSDLLGSVKYMKSSGDFLYMCVGGEEGEVAPTTRNARVMAFNGKGWHSMYKNATDNQQITWLDVGSEDDGVSRLHFAVTTATAKSTTAFLGHANNNPSSGVAVKRAVFSDGIVGHIDLPFVDFGLPQEQKNFTRVHVIAADLNDASNEFVELLYGIDDADRTTDLGDFLSGNSSLDFGSSLGVSAKNIGLRLRLKKRGSSGVHTPKVRDVVLEGYVVPSIAYEHEMTIDIARTSQNTGQSAAAVITALESLVSSVPQVVMKFAGESRNVAVDRDRSGFNFTLEGFSPNVLTERAGYFTLVLVEKLS